MTHSRFSITACLALSLLGFPAVAQTIAQNDSSAKAAAKANTLPLIPARTLSFTTSEGSWISLDISPDGRTIIFDLLGDLYTIPIAGGRATRITSNAGYDQQPRFSPDGKQIAFVTDRNGAKNLWVAHADGTGPRALTKTERQNFSSPVWTPDGQYLIVTRAGQLWLYNKDGGSGLQMTGQMSDGTPPTPSTQPMHLGAAFGNDPAYVWVNVTGTVRSGLIAAGSGDIYGDLHSSGNAARISRSTQRLEGEYQIAQLERETGRTFIRTHELEGAFRPMPSPDGRWLIYSTRYDARGMLKLRDLTTGEERWLVVDVQRDNAEGRGVNDRDVYPGSAWTPDSRALITSFNGKIWRVDVPSGQLTEIPFSAQVEQQLGPLAKFDYPMNDSVLTVAQIRGAKPSPNGRQLTFTALDALWIADLPPAGGGLGMADIIVRDARRLTTSEGIVEHAPVWSPDGRYIAYVTWSDSVGGDVYRIAVQNGQPERLTRTSAFYDKIAYSADGSKIMGVRGSKMHRVRTLEDFGSHGAHAELEYIWLPARGGETHRIVWVGTGATEQGRNVPHVGPDTSRFYVWTGADGLVSMRFDGTDRKLVMKVTGPPRPTGAPGQNIKPAPPDEVLISPDGTRALVRADRNVYEIAVPPVAGQSATVSVSPGSVVPTARLTRIGGDFIGWQNDGKSAYYSIGRSFFRYDVQLADSLVRDSVARAEAAIARADAQDDTIRRATPVYEPQRYDIEITARKDKPSGILALRSARIITMKGDEVIAKGDIVVRDNRIVGVGASGTVDIPAEAKVIDVSGKTIMPGYVDIHAHAWVAWGVHREQVSQFMAQLAYGVTTQRDPQTSSEDILTYSDLMETGALIGPRLYSTGPGIFATENIKSLDDARDILRRYSEFFHTNTIKQYLAGDRKVRQWVIMAARELGLTATTEGGSNFTMNLTLMQDGYPGLEHSLPIDPLERDVVQLASFSGITYTPTLIVSYGGPWGRQYWLTHYDLHADSKLRRFTPHDELDKWKNTDFHRDDQYVFTNHAKQLTKIVEAGGRVGLGSHGEVQGIGVHWELWMLASGGMKNHDVLRAATMHGADAIGLAKDIGSLEVGKMADLQVLDRNPLEDLKSSRSIEYVMKNGRLYEAATLNEIWPRTRILPTQWWWRMEPPPPARSSGER